MIDRRNIGYGREEDTIIDQTCTPSVAVVILFVYLSFGHSTGEDVVVGRSLSLD